MALISIDEPDEDRAGEEPVAKDEER